MKLKGRVWKFGDNVNTDEIIPAQFLKTTDPKQLGRHCMEGIDRKFAKNVRRGDIVVAGKNFGCGSSREHAPIAIKGCGIECVIAESFARIFYRNSINMGLPILEAPEAARAIRGSDIVEVDLSRGQIRDLNQDRVYQALPFPEFMQELICAGGLMKWIKARSLKARSGSVL